MGRIKDYINEVKEETKKDTDDYGVSDGSFENQVMNELKEDLAEDKKDLTITGGIIIAMFLIFVLIVGVIYLCFHKQFEKKINDYIDSIPVYKAVDDGNSNNDPNSGDECYIHTYKLGIEEIEFGDYNSYTFYSNNAITDFGDYTVNDKNIVTTSNLTPGIASSFIISNDCNTVKEISSGKTFIKQK